MILPALPRRAGSLSSVSDMRAEAGDAGVEGLDALT